jgi:hypothetical protein
MNASTRRILAALLLAAAFLGSAFAADRHDSRPVADYDSLVLAAPLRLEIVQGDRQGLELDGDEAALALIEAVVEDRVLKIRLKTLTTNWKREVRGVLHARRMDGVAIVGAGEVRSNGLKGVARLSITGAGDLTLTSLASSALELAIVGGGDVKLTGKADAFRTSISGAADIDAGRLESRKVKVSIVGAGDAKVWAKETLDISISGAGDVGYYGDPVLERAVRGASDIRRLGAAPSS